MIAVITGDIINSQGTLPEQWLPRLKGTLQRYGDQPREWEIFQGDSFQLIIQNPRKALKEAMYIKAVIKKLKPLDVRMAIGLGDSAYEAERITESNGSAFVHSGRGYESLKAKKRTLGIFSDYQGFNDQMNVIIPLMLIAMDNWSPGAAEMVSISLEHPKKSQKEIGALLGIAQSSVSQRYNSSYLKELQDAESLYRREIKALSKVR